MLEAVQRLIGIAGMELKNREDKAKILNHQIKN